jgi:hypothetical protein
MISKVSGASHSPAPRTRNRKISQKIVVTYRTASDYFRLVGSNFWDSLLHLFFPSLPHCDNMSADRSTAFNKLAEHMPLFPDPAANDATSALARKSGDVSKRLELVLAQCQTDSEIDRELWDDFEVRRRSAETYINRYLDCLKQVHEERSGQVYEISDPEDEALPTGNYTKDPWYQNRC